MSNLYERVRGRFGRRPVPPPPAPPVASPAADLLAASDDCDAAAAALAEAMTARRKALNRLWAATPLAERSLINRQMSIWAVGRALWFHGEALAAAIGLPFVASFHRATFGHAARMLIGSVGRAEPQTIAPAPAGHIEETALAQAH